MSGAEIWDLGIIRPVPENPVPAGPAFLGPEQLKAVNHAIEEADRLMKTGNSIEAFDVIQRALQRYPHSSKLSDWMLRQ